MTTRSVRARYRNGVLEPLDDVGLQEDQEVLLTFQQQATTDDADSDAFVDAAGGWADMFEDPEQFIRQIYQARLDGSREPPTL